MRINKAYKDFIDNTDRFNVIFGGAGSGKSYAIAQKIVKRLTSEKKHKILVLRKVDKTLKNSVFSLIKSVIAEEELTDSFKFTVSPMEIIFVNGNSAVFLGLDDPEKIKSIADITSIWIEEATELNEEDFNQLNLRLRGKTPNYKQIILSFNPVSALSWIKKRFFDSIHEKPFICHTTYKDNSFLDEDYIKELENLINVDPVFYDIYTLGKWGVLGNLVYSNYIIEPFDNDPKLFNTIYNGLDWGFNDPTALLRIGMRDNELYILSEMYVKGKTNPELMELALDYITKSDPITADSAEPKSITEWRHNGFRIEATVKGKDSIKYGIDFVRRHKIHIHPTCQNFINEIQGYAYAKDKDGNVLEEPVDFRNHLMDAMRYALEQLAFKREIKAIDRIF